MKQNSPLLSIGMIVKNEMRCIEKCLKALQPLRDAIPCELVIADTGSTDGTREFVMRYADIFFDFEWINDFSAARNAVIEHSTGKWYLSIDADEYLQPQIEELVAFLNGPIEEEIAFGTVIIRNHQHKDLTGEYSEFPALRLAKKTADLAYFGAIHEAFHLSPGLKIRELATVIFDHDGYSEINPEFTRKKAARNVALLEEDLKRDPTDLWRLLQCLESASALPEKRFQYAYYAMDLIMGDQEHSPHWKKYAPVIARKTTEIAVAHQLPEADQWVLWARSNFPSSLHVQIDTNFAYIVKLDTENRYEELSKVGKDYLKALKQYKKSGPSTPELYTSGLFKAHLKFETQARLLIAQATRKTGKLKESFKVLREMEFGPDDTDTLLKWMYSLEELQELPEAAELAAQKLGHLFEHNERTENEENQSHLALRRITDVFSVPVDFHQLFRRLYRNMPGTIGKCARLAETNDREQAEEILNEIDNWELFMPLALARVMSLGAELPDAFYHISANRLHELENALPKCDPNFSSYVTAYTAPEKITDWHRLCFAFELLTTAWISNPEEKDRAVLAQRFTEVSSALLREYYNPALLKNEAAVGRLPALHRFAWYFTQAVEFRQNGDSAGCVHSLRTALEQAKAMKALISYLIDQIHEEQEKQVIVTNASPELLALAKQVKTILAAYPADDPAVLAIKQSPAYQQVAFLIEEPDGLTQ